MVHVLNESKINSIIMKNIINILFIIILSSLKSFSQDKFWPHEINKDGYIMKIYEPENETYINHRVKSKAAISIQSKDAKDPVFGVIWTTAFLDADRENKMAKLVSVEVTEIRFPETVSKAEQNNYKNIIETEIPSWDIDISIPELVNSLSEVSAHVNDLKAEAPNFLFATEPSVLVIIDGNPKFKSIDNSYELIQNSTAFIAKDKSSSTYYLKGGNFWYSASSPMGPWASGKKAPKKLIKIAKESSSEAKDDDKGDSPTYDGGPPKIVIGSVGTELINIDGEPSFAPLQNTNLLHVKNSDADLFLDVKSQNYYILTSGRWFRSKAVKGPWQHLLSDELPSDFKSIDPEGDKGHTLSSIAGTEEAKNAIYDAQIPQTASVNRATTKASKVNYNGSPEFEKIKGLNLQHAVNTESSVFKDGSTYYLCDNGIWFESNSPSGQWTVSDNRPAEVTKIPASHPTYHTKYVYIYETTPTVVYVGYTPGYSGSYIYHNTVVYGTGHYYNPWYNGYYYHRRYTYGFNIRYNSWNGWSFGFSFGSPYSWWGYNYWRPGWNNWGPHYYRPPYYHRRGYYRPNRPPYHRRDGVAPYRHPNPKPYNRPGSRPNTRPAPRPNTRPNTRPAPRPNTRPNTRPAPQPNTRPNTRPAPRPNTRPNTRPAPRPNTRPAPRPNTRPAPRPTVRPSIRPHTRATPPRKRTSTRSSSRTMNRRG